MDKKLEIAQAKELRGEIIGKLYGYYGEDIALNTIKNLLRYKNYYSEKDVKRAVCYLAGAGKAYVHINSSREDYWDSMVQLTPAGVNLAEGDIQDLGVLIDG